MVDVGYVRLRVDIVILLLYEDLDLESGAQVC